MLNSFKRVIKSGFKAFFRNAGLGAATIFVMVMVIFLVTMLWLLNPASEILVENIQEKVDVSVYFKKDAQAEEILQAKSEITKISEVREVEYVSKEQALEKFIERHKDDPTLMESLTEVGENPFLASLNIKAQQASQYEQVASFLESSDFSGIIDKVDYHQRKPVIDKVISMTNNINKFGIVLGIVLGVIAVLIAYNTIRLAIYNSSREISTMRLVGASNWFIRGPFLIQGIIVGVLAGLITLIITFGVSYGFNAKVASILSGVSMMSLFLSNFWTIILIQFVTGTGLGIISSMIAIRKFLKV